MNLSWTIPSDVNAETYKYNIHGEPDNITVSSTSSFMLVAGLSPGTNYTFTIYTETQNGVQSSKFQQTTNTTLPSSVSDFKVIGVWTKEMNLSWTIPSDVNAETYKYNIHREPGNITVSSSSSFKLVTQLLPGTNYSFTIYTETQNGVQSSEFQQTTNTTLPSSVSDFRVIGVWTKEMNLSWTIPSDVNAETYKYNIHREPGNITVSSTSSFMLVTQLSPGTNYTFTIYTETQNGVQSSKFERTTNTTLPSLVTGLSVTSVSDNSVILVWMLSSDPNSQLYTYTVAYGRSHYIANIKENITEVTNLTAGTDYNFTVFAVTPNGVYSEPSDHVNATTLPSPVKDLEVSSVSNDSVTLEWMLSSDPNSNSYTYTVADGESNRMTHIKENIMVIENLTAGTNYDFMVFAVTENGIYSNSSNVVNATTRPNIVQGVNVSSVSETTATLQWDSSKDSNTDRYTYTVDVYNTTFFKIENIRSNSEVIPNLSPGVDYNFTVFAVTENGIYSQSSEVVYTTTIPNAPRDLRGNAVSVSEIDVTWTAPTDVNEKSYVYMVTWDDKKISQTNTTTEKHYNISKLLPGHLYTITVRSVIKNTSSVHYDETYTVTMPLSTERLENGTISNTSITLAWAASINPDSFVTGYRVTVYSNGTKKFQSETTETTFVVNKLDPGSIYSFTVESYARHTIPGTANRMATGDYIISYSTPSSIQAETVPDPVQNLRCSKVDAYQIKLDFQCPAGNYSKFEVLVDNINDNKVGSSDCEKSVIISQLQPTVRYSITVKTIATDKYIFTDPINCETDSTGVIVGSIFGVLLFLLLMALIAFFVLRRRRLKNGSENIPTTFKPRRFPPIPKDKFKQHYENNHADSDFGFAEEYQELSLVGTSQSKRIAEFPENRPKNRFTNVLPYDHSRVKLSVMNGISTSDYMNANYMPGYNSNKEFIASQGPLPNTTTDFWRMVWEHQVNTVLMLTNCMENGRVKCEHYWPLDYTPCTYGDITVTVTSETILSEWTIRDFSVKHANQPGIKYVRHFHFTAWPDHGVPDSTSSILKFRNLVREHMDQRKSNGPTVVHCSAGVGRTGTLIALDYLIQQVEKEQRIGIHGFVEKMRINRNLMVQTEAQYIFLNKCMLDLIEQPAEENIYESPTGTELLYENVSAIRNLQRENVN
ncbi:hypothetical protein GDO78_010699 [Eleutherodactylus coqui]|uniref:protein-tyrosine-phosphatase n=1 Tax=Eleutherodactylus coqui TaxID=57060 RepID=A0A8J6F5R9_ELECQ|nr:hypothetical protein GDO78_010699 [Eleutherodactylus coqui]